MTVFAFLESLIDVPLIRGKQNVNKQTKPHAKYLIQNTRKPENSEKLPVNEFGFRNVGGHETVSVEIEFFGKDAYWKATDLQGRFDTDSAIDAGLALGLNVIDKGTVTDLTALLNETQWEARALLEFRLTAAYHIMEEAFIIDDVEVNGRVFTPNYPENP